MARSSRFALDGAATQCDGLRADHIELAGPPPLISMIREPDSIEKLPFTARWPGE